MAGIPAAIPCNSCNGNMAYMGLIDSYHCRCGSSVSRISPYAQMQTSQNPMPPQRPVASNAIPPGTYSGVAAQYTAQQAQAFISNYPRYARLVYQDDIINDELTKPPTEPSIWSEEDAKARKRCDELGMPFSFYQGLVTAARSLAGKNLLTASITKDGLLKLSYQGYDVLLKITEIDVVPNDRG